MMRNIPTDNGRRRTFAKGLVLCAGLVFTVVAMYVGSQSLAQEGEKKAEAVPGKSDTLKWAEAHFHYVGEAKCKTCHKAEYTSWQESKHAKAWAALSAEEQKNKECAGCHITGMTEDDSVLVNVGCESCHGPGSDYRKMKNMKDPKLAVETGLLPITEATCVRCHNKKSPNYKEFKYEEFLKTGVHAHPEKKTG